MDDLSQDSRDPVAAKLIKRAERNTKWLNENYDDLVSQYDGKWVAVLDARVIDSDEDLKILVARLGKKLSERYSEATVEYVTRKPLSLIL
jgi:hypothetical protein